MGLDSEQRKTKLKSERETLVDWRHCNYCMKSQIQRQIQHCLLLHLSLQGNLSLHRYIYYSISLVYLPLDQLI